MLVHQTTNSVGNYNYNTFIYDNCEWYYHFHKNYELVYVMSGGITAMIDTHLENLQAGDFALILPNQLHSYHTSQNSKVWIGVFSEDYVFTFSTQISKRVGEQAKFQCDPVIQNYIIHELIEDDIRDIFILKSCFYAVCSQYIKAVKLVTREFDNNDLISKIVDYVSNHFKTNITLDKMAHDLGFEYHYLSRRFHYIFNMNFRQFVNQYRVNYAKELLAQNYGSISDIAFESGFQNIRCFNHIYLKFYGVVPSKHYGL